MGQTKALGKAIQEREGNPASNPIPMATGKLLIPSSADLDRYNGEQLGDNHEPTRQVSGEACEYLEDLEDHPQLLKPNHVGEIELKVREMDKVALMEGVEDPGDGRDRGYDRKRQDKGGERAGWT